jgi:hypothetical protein
MPDKTVVGPQSYELDEYGETVRVFGLVIRANFARDGEPGTVEMYRERGFRPLSSDESASLGVLLLELSEVVRLPAEKARVVRSALDTRRLRG